MGRIGSGGTTPIRTDAPAEAVAPAAPAPVETPPSEPLRTAIVGSDFGYRPEARATTSGPVLPEAPISSVDMAANAEALLTRTEALTAAFSTAAAAVPPVEISNLSRELALLLHRIAVSDPTLATTLLARLTAAEATVHTAEILRAPTDAGDLSVALIRDTLLAGFTGAPCPSGGSTATYRQAVALGNEGFTAADIGELIAGGGSPSEALQTRITALEARLSSTGGWRPQNALTALSDLRLACLRAHTHVLESERTVLRETLATLPTDDPRRAGLEESIETRTTMLGERSEQLEILTRSRNRLASSGSAARAHHASDMCDRAERAEARAHALEVRAGRTSDPDEVRRLSAEAGRLRERAGRLRERAREIFDSEEAYATRIITRRGGEAGAPRWVRERVREAFGGEADLLVDMDRVEIERIEETESLLTGDTAAGLSGIEIEVPGHPPHRDEAMATLDEAERLCPSLVDDDAHLESRTGVHRMDRRYSSASITELERRRRGLEHDSVLPRSERREALSAIDDEIGLAREARGSAATEIDDLASHRMELLGPREELSGPDSLRWAALADERGELRVEVVGAARDHEAARMEVRRRETEITTLEDQIAELRTQLTTLGDAWRDSGHDPSMDEAGRSVRATLDARERDLEASRAGLTSATAEARRTEGTMLHYALMLDGALAHDGHGRVGAGTVAIDAAAEGDSLELAADRAYGAELDRVEARGGPPETLEALRAEYADFLTGLGTYGAETNELMRPFETDLRAEARAPSDVALPTAPAGAHPERSHRFALDRDQRFALATYSLARGEAMARSVTDDDTRLSLMAGIVDAHARVGEGFALERPRDALHEVTIADELVSSDVRPHDATLADHLDERVAASASAITSTLFHSAVRMREMGSLDPEAGPAALTLFDRLIHELPETSRLREVFSAQLTQLHEELAALADIGDLTANAEEAALRADLRALAEMEETADGMIDMRTSDIVEFGGRVGLVLLLASGVGIPLAAAYLGAAVAFDLPLGISLEEMDREQMHAEFDLREAEITDASARSRRSARAVTDIFRSALSEGDGAAFRTYLSAVAYAGDARSEDARIFADALPPGARYRGSRNPLTESPYFRAVFRDGAPPTTVLDAARRSRTAVHTEAGDRLMERARTEFEAFATESERLAYFWAVWDAAAITVATWGLGSAFAAGRSAVMSIEVVQAVLRLERVMAAMETLSEVAQAARVATAFEGSTFLTAAVRMTAFNGATALLGHAGDAVFGVGSDGARLFRLSLNLLSVSAVNRFANLGGATAVSHITSAGFELAMGMGTAATTSIGYPTMLEWLHIPPDPLRDEIAGVLLGSIIPAGVSGIVHMGNPRRAAAAHVESLHSAGIDAEVVRAAEPQLRELIMRFERENSGLPHESTYETLRQDIASELEGADPELAGRAAAEIIANMRTERAMSLALAGEGMLEAGEPLDMFAAERTLHSAAGLLIESGVGRADAYARVSARLMHATEGSPIVQQRLRDAVHAEAIAAGTPESRHAAVADAMSSLFSDARTRLNASDDAVLPADFFVRAERELRAAAGEGFDPAETLSDLRRDLASSVIGQELGTFVEADRVPTTAERSALAARVSERTGMPLDEITVLTTELVRTADPVPGERPTGAIIARDSSTIETTPPPPSPEVMTEAAQTVFGHAPSPPEATASTAEGLSYAESLVALLSNRLQAEGADAVLAFETALHDVESFLLRAGSMTETVLRDIFTTLRGTGRDTELPPPPDDTLARANADLASMAERMRDPSLLGDVVIDIALTESTLRTAVETGDTSFINATLEALRTTATADRAALSEVVTRARALDSAYAAATVQTWLRLPAEARASMSEALCGVNARAATVAFTRVADLLTPQNTGRLTPEVLTAITGSISVIREGDSGGMLVPMRRVTAGIEALLRSDPVVAAVWQGELSSTPSLRERGLLLATMAASLDISRATSSERPPTHMIILPDASMVAASISDAAIDPATGLPDPSSRVTARYTAADGSVRETTLRLNEVGLVFQSEDTPVARRVGETTERAMRRGFLHMPGDPPELTRAVVWERGRWVADSAAEYHPEIHGLHALELSPDMLRRYRRARDQLLRTERARLDELLSSHDSAEMQMLMFHAFAAHGDVDHVESFVRMVSTLYPNGLPDGAALLRAATVDGLIQYYNDSCALTAPLFARALADPLEAITMIARGPDGLIAEQADGLVRSRGRAIRRGDQNEGRAIIGTGGGRGDAPIVDVLTPEGSAGLFRAELESEWNRALRRVLEEDNVRISVVTDPVSPRACGSLEAQLWQMLGTGEAPAEGVLGGVAWTGGGGHAIVFVSARSEPSPSGVRDPATTYYTLRDPWTGRTFERSGADLIVGRAPSDGFGAGFLTGLGVRTVSIESGYSTASIERALSARFTGTTDRAVLGTGAMVRHADGSTGRVRFGGARVEAGELVYRFASGDGTEWTATREELLDPDFRPALSDSPLRTALLGERAPLTDGVWLEIDQPPSGRREAVVTGVRVERDGSVTYETTMRDTGTRWEVSASAIAAGGGDGFTVHGVGMPEHPLGEIPSSAGRATRSTTVDASRAAVAGPELPGDPLAALAEATTEAARTDAAMEIATRELPAPAFDLESPTLTSQVRTQIDNLASRLMEFGVSAIEAYRRVGAYVRNSLNQALASVGIVTEAISARFRRALETTAAPPPEAAAASVAPREPGGVALPPADPVVDRAPRPDLSVLSAAMRRDVLMLIDNASIGGLRIDTSLRRRTSLWLGDATNEAQRTAISELMPYLQMIVSDVAATEARVATTAVLATHPELSETARSAALELLVDERIHDGMRPHTRELLLAELINEGMSAEAAARTANAITVELAIAEHWGSTASSSTAPTAADRSLQPIVDGIAERFRSREFTAHFLTGLTTDVDAELARIPEDAPNRGRTALLRVATRRMEAAGLIVRNPEGGWLVRPGRLTATEDTAFLQSLGNGPFFDFAFEGGDHGSDTHILQMLALSDYLNESLAGRSEEPTTALEFFRYMATREGLPLWQPLFDANSGDFGLVRPERLGEMVYETIVPRGDAELARRARDSHPERRAERFEAMLSASAVPPGNRPMAMARMREVLTTEYRSTSERAYALRTVVLEAGGDGALYDRTFGTLRVRERACLPDAARVRERFGTDAELYNRAYRATLTRQTAATTDGRVVDGPVFLAATERLSALSRLLGEGDPTTLRTLLGAERGTPLVFVDEVTLRQAELRTIAGAGVSDAAIAELSNIAGGSLAADTTTGLASAAMRVPTLTRAQALLAAEPSAHGFYIEADIRNLSGLNAALGHSGADAVYRRIAEIFRDELASVGVSLSAFRHGGDEISAVLVGRDLDPAVVRAAIDRAQSEVARYVASETITVRNADGTTRSVALATINHPKHDGMAAYRGTGIAVGMTEFSPDTTPSEIFATADRAVEANKVSLGIPDDTEGPAHPAEASLRPGAIERIIVPSEERTAAQITMPEGRTSFGSAVEERRAVFARRCTELRISPAAAARMFEAAGGTTIEPVTGIEGATARIPTVERAMRFVDARPNESAFYVEGDIANLGGLNAVLGHTGANAVYRVMTDIFSQELRAIGGDVTFFRHGGDEVSAVIVGPGLTREMINSALASASERMEVMAERTMILDADGTPRSLAELAHPKHLEEREYDGTGMVFGVAEIEGPPATSAEIISTADREVEARKRARGEAHVD